MFFYFAHQIINTDSYSPFYHIIFLRPRRDLNGEFFGSIMNFLAQQQDGALAHFGYDQMAAESAVLEQTEMAHSRTHGFRHNAQRGAAV